MAFTSKKYLNFPFKFYLHLQRNNFQVDVKFYIVSIS